MRGQQFHNEYQHYVALYGAYGINRFSRNGVLFTLTPHILWHGFSVYNVNTYNPYHNCGGFPPTERNTSSLPVIDKAGIPKERENAANR